MQQWAWGLQLRGHEFEYKPTLCHVTTLGLTCACHQGWRCSMAPKVTNRPGRNNGTLSLDLWLSAAGWMHRDQDWLFELSSSCIRTRILAAAYLTTEVERAWLFPHDSADWLPSSQTLLDSACRSRPCHPWSTRCSAVSPACWHSSTSSASHTPTAGGETRVGSSAHLSDIASGTRQRSAPPTSGQTECRQGLDRVALPEPITV